MAAFRHFDILPFDTEAAAIFHRLKSTHSRIGTMDLNIAAICLAHDATLRTRNLADFQNIPDLRFENWLD
jgi:tRNA(fMet)-specific endonuclease VapC